jgi:hypothetical protein
MLAKNEEETGKAIKDEEDEDSSEGETSTQASSPTTPAPTPRPTPVRAATIDWAGIEGLGFKGISLLTPEEKKYVLAFDKTEKLFKYDPKAGECYACSDKDCGFPAPNSFTHCPQCGIELPAVD